MVEPENAPAAAPAELPVARMTYNIRWLSLPRTLMVEVEHHASLTKEDLETMSDKLGGIIQKYDLATRTDEASLAGLCRFFCRLTHKMLAGQVGMVTVAWQPEMISLDAKEYAKS